MKLIFLLTIREFKRLWNLNDINVNRYGGLHIKRKKKPWKFSTFPNQASMMENNEGIAGK